MAANAATLDLFVDTGSGYEVHFPAPGYPLDARHDPDKGHGVAWSMAATPGGQSLGMVDVPLVRDELVFRRDNLNAATWAAFLALMAQTQTPSPGNEKLVAVSPVGSGVYGAHENLLVSDGGDWEEVSPGRFAAAVRLVRVSGASL